MPIIIAIDGYIGAGKTTLINELLSCKLYNINIVCLNEPIDIWENLDILDRFYNNKQQYALDFQLLVLLTKKHRLESLLEKSGEQDIIIMERSFYSDNHSFAEQILDDDKYKIYNDVYNDIISNKYEPNIYTLLDTDIDICISRIRKRNRKGEEHIDRTYLKKTKTKSSNFKYIKIKSAHDIINIIKTYL